VSDSLAVVISAAGLGSRLDYGMPKCLVPVCGQPLIFWQLTALRQIDPEIEVVVVAGFQSSRVAGYLRQFFPTVPVMLNHRFRSTGTAGSLVLGAGILETEWVLSLDGDLLLDRPSLNEWVNGHGAQLGVSPKTTRTPVGVALDENAAVVGMGFDIEGDLEWNGLIRLPRSVVLDFNDQHVFPNLLKHLPLPALLSETVEIDDPDDLDRAEVWLRGRIDEERGRWTS